MPPQTPSRMRTGGGSAVGGLDGQQAGVDLPPRDRQRLLLVAGLHQRADVLEQTLVQLGVVGVDLPGALGSVDHQGVLGLSGGEELVDGRVGDASGDATVPDMCAQLRGRVVGGRLGVPGGGRPGGPRRTAPVYRVRSPITEISSSVARCTSSLTITWSNSSAGAPRARRSVNDGSRRQASSSA